MTRTYTIPTKRITNSDAVGIDLGTSRCFAAVNRRDGVVTLALDNLGERQLPSYVSFKNEQPECGQIILNRLARDAKSTVFNFKQMIGRNFDEIEIDPIWHFKIINDGGKPVLRIQSVTGDIQKTPEEVAAVLLKHIKEKVEQFQGRLLEKVVISVPTAFNEKQRSAIVTAAKMAGWRDVELLPQPIAAAFAYFVDRPIPIEFTMLIFDCGGANLDVCIMKVSHNNLHMLGSTGYSNLGGRDFDNLLFHHFADILKSQFDIDVETKDRLKYFLLQKCMEIKHTLSVQREDT